MRQAAVFLTLGVVFAQGVPAYAHAKLLSANPVKDSTAPGSFSRVELGFGEAIEPALSYLELLDAQGKRLERIKGNDACTGKTCQFTVKPLADGKYRVRYHVLSSDGHVVDESYTFTVKNAQ